MSTDTPPRWTYSTPDFRYGPKQLDHHDGKAYWFQVCETLEDGRWEGFVSMWPATDQDDA